jgi:hypothetical protein
VSKPANLPCSGKATFILTAEGAVEYGVVDEVITSRKIIRELAATEPKSAALSAMNHAG